MNRQEITNLWLKQVEGRIARQEALCLQGNHILEVCYPLTEDKKDFDRTKPYMVCSHCGVRQDEVKDV